MNRRFQRYIVHMEILSTFHAWVKYIPVKIMHHSNQWEWKPPKFPLSLGAHGPPSNTPIPRPTPLTTPTAARSVHTLCNKFPLVTMGCPTLTPKTALSPLMITTHLIHPFLDWPRLLPQMASRSNQPFCYNALSRQTDRLTNGIGNRSVRRALALCYIDRDQSSNNDKTLGHNWRCHPSGCSGKNDRRIRWHYSDYTRRVGLSSSIVTTATHHALSSRITIIRGIFSIAKILGRQQPPNYKW